MGSHRVGHDWSDLAAAAAESFWCVDILYTVPRNNTNALCHCSKKCSNFAIKEIGSLLLFRILKGESKSGNNFPGEEYTSVQFSSVVQLCPTLCNPMNCSTPGLPVHHHLPEFTQAHVHRVCDDIQPSLPRSSPSPPAPNPSQHQSFPQWVNSLHEVAKVLELQL